MRKSMLAMVAVCALLSGCADKPVPPFASMPFSVAKKANAVSIPFSVGPFAEFGYTYMLAFKFKQPEQGDPMMMLWSDTPQRPLRLRVKLVRIERGSEQVVAINDRRPWFHDRAGQMRCLPDDMQTRGSDIADVSMHSYFRDTAEMEVVYFHLPDKGFYRFDVETLDDMPMFEHVISWLTVERRYPHGK